MNFVLLIRCLVGFIILLFRLILIKFEVVILL